MTRHLGRTLLPVLLSATVLLAAPAHAERVSVDDVAGDVVEIPGDAGPSDTELVVPAPDETTVDVVRTVVDHRRAAVRVTVSVRDLQRRYFSQQVVGLVRTPRTTWTVTAERTNGQVVSQLYGRRSAPACPGLRTTLDRSTDAIVLRVPTRCIGDPAWVQVGLALVGIDVVHDPATGDAGTVHVDEAGTDGYADGPIVLGPRVHRG
ncbi:hypothetical protein KDN32_05450 [Nocardioides sp. J2M5]|uniref:hypothetical protein n=1 Tax=Nocardioides palaemonis TaxID=2829810 RepID=UPI001BA473A9|nr:hypothetical protein [Nocardioides palaemonis]MBS2937182.1 hypothetical protein [Nocardioides palaemonis]